MPKPPRGKDSDYLRFRPYHAFTSPRADSAKAAQRSLLWGGVMLAGAVAVVVAVALWLHGR